jgi:hypothetical protein
MRVVVSALQPDTSERLYPTRIGFIQSEQNPRLADRTRGDSVAVAGAIHDQELMFDETDSADLRWSEPQNGGDEMNQENNQIVHVRR